MSSDTSHFHPFSLFDHSFYLFGYILPLEHHHYNVGPPPLGRPVVVHDLPIGYGFGDAATLAKAATLTTDRPA